VQILARFLKITNSAFDAPQAGWRKEILGFRLSLKRRLTPTLRHKLEESLPSLYADAVKLARVSFEADEPDTTLDLPDECPFSLHDILGGDDGDWLPTRSAAG
jgi:hypothetical protein